jgi:Protein of unknown function (DUF1266)
MAIRNRWPLFNLAWPKPRTKRRYPVPLTVHQLWMVSLGAPVRKEKGTSYDTLYPFTRVDEEQARAGLAAQWQITTMDQFVGRLDELVRYGYRARTRQRLGVEPLAWDAALYADIVRRGFAAGLLSEADAWTALKNIVPAVVRSYASWREYAGHYLLGRTVWQEMLCGTPDQKFPAPRVEADAHLRSLLDPDNRSRPWNLAPFDAISDPDRKR